jgi:hypothetical protein
MDGARRDPWPSFDARGATRGWRAVVIEPDC